MKKFIQKVLLLLVLPILIIFLSIELFINIYPNTFTQKAKYFKKNKGNIEVLFLGSSHTMDGINPEYIDIPSANIGYGRQDYQIDSALLNKYIDQMPKLKAVVHEFDYLDLYKEMDSTYFRYPWYEKLYDIKLGIYPKYHKYSFYLSNPDFFNAILIRAPWEKNKINEYGYNDVEPEFEFYKANYDSITLAKEMKVEEPLFKFSPIDQDRYHASLRRLKQMRALCKSRGVDYIPMTYPMHPIYYSNILDSKTYILWREEVTKLENQGYKVWDFEKNSIFFTRDFTNPSHLNNTGSKKFSQIINDSINKYYR